MLGIRTLVDIGFFLSIIGFVVYPFVNEATRQDKTCDTAPPTRSGRAEVFEVDIVDPSESNHGEARSFEIPTLTIDALGRKVRGIYLDGTEIEAVGISAEVKKRGIRRLLVDANPDAARQVIMDAKRLCKQGGVTSFADTRDPSNPVLID